jgi:hypothetical protein
MAHNIKLPKKSEIWVCGLTPLMEEYVNIFEVFPAKNHYE